ncbi:hypothetical protein CDAR_567681 [Caerostris darwini]|uniref:Uncharacterized protein n=1 Tax=Caerostris darwini TaxID=1538125 RepID=A0AAV4WCT0_9ARAC|nr:hypothetical protein CDAR_567681 [Caerostris darwini]
MDDTPNTDRKAKGKYNFHIFLGIDSSEKRVSGQAFIHHREGDILFKRDDPPLSPPGDKADISTTDGALSRGARAIFGKFSCNPSKFSCDFRLPLRKQD